MAIDVDRTTTEAGAYPIVLVSYLIACPTYDDAKTADLVKGYLSYVVSADGQAAAAKAAGSAPLSSSLSDEAAKQVDTITAELIHTSHRARGPRRRQLAGDTDPDVGRTRQHPRAKDETVTAPQHRRQQPARPRQRAG